MAWKEKNDPAIAAVGNIMDAAILKALEGDVLTPGVRGGKASMDEFKDAIIARL